MNISKVLKTIFVNTGFKDNIHEYWFLIKRHFWLSTVFSQVLFFGRTFFEKRL